MSEIFNKKTAISIGIGSLVALFTASSLFGVIAAGVSRAFQNNTAPAY